MKGKKELTPFKEVSSILNHWKQEDIKKTVRPKSQDFLGTGLTPGPSYS
jgi:hypothetical protein